MAKTKNPPPKPAPARIPFVIGQPVSTPHPASVPGPSFALPAAPLARGPTAPHSALLTIARAPGGFVLLDPEIADGNVHALTPLQALAVAATPADLAAQVTAWAAAAPAAEYPA